MQLSTVIKQALDIWQNPPSTELSDEAIVDVANRCVSQRFLDLDLTPDACFMTVKSDSFQFASHAAREKNVTNVLDDLSRVIRIESRGPGSTNEDGWTEEERASYENWNDIVERNDDNFCSIYQNVDGETFLVVARDVFNLSFRIVYKTLRTKINTPQEMVDLPEIFETVLVYDMALEFGEMIDNLSPEFQKKYSTKMPYLELRLADAMKRADKWRRNQRGTSIVTRRAFNDRNGVFNLRTRRFTVTFPSGS